MPNTSLAHGATPAADAAATVSARFLVMAEADPGLLPRLLEPFSKLGLVPSRVHASREDGDGSVVSVDLRMKDVAPRAAELVENSLRRVLGVSQLIAVVE
jgi:hypothetical protein